MRYLLKFRWMWIFPWIKGSWHACSMWDKFWWLNWFWQFLCEGLPSFNPKGICHSHTWFCILWERGASFAWDASPENSVNFYMFLRGFTSFSALFLFSLSITFLIFVHGFWCYFSSIVCEVNETVFFFINIISV